MRRTLLIAGASIYAAMYVALVYIFGFISYGQINVRVANVLTGLVPIMGWPGVLGQTIGVFIANTQSPLGSIDLLNTIPTFVFSWVIWKSRRVSVFLGLALYSAALGITVSLALNYAFAPKVPILVTIIYVTVGNFVATAILGYILYRSAKRTKVLARYFEE